MNIINLHNKFLSYKEKETRLVTLSNRITSLLAMVEIEEVPEKEFREELRAIDFEFKKINHYETLIAISEDPEIIDNMMFVVDSKIEEASYIYNATY